MNHEDIEHHSKEQFRVVIGRESNDALERCLAKINKESPASRISKSDLANFIFTRIEDLFSDADVAEIRAIYFDAKKALEGILKEEQSLPESLREAVLKHCGIKAAIKERKSKKLSTPKLVDNKSVGA